MVLYHFVKLIMTCRPIMAKKMVNNYVYYYYFCQLIHRPVYVCVVCDLYTCVYIMYISIIEGQKLMEGN